MSTIGSMAGLVASAAGTPMSQANSSASSGVYSDAAAVERRVSTEEKAERADGIGQTEEDEQTDERDADGRRLWERTRRSAAANEDEPTQLSKDITGDAGTTLDLVG